MSEEIKKNYYWRVTINDECITIIVAPNGYARHWVLHEKGNDDRESVTNFDPFIFNEDIKKMLVIFVIIFSCAK